MMRSGVFLVSAYFRSGERPKVAKNRNYAAAPGNSSALSVIGFNKDVTSGSCSVVLFSQIKVTILPILFAVETRGLPSDLRLWMHFLISR